MAGRRPKPTAVKALAGNPGKRKPRKREPKPKTAGTPQPPDWMGGFGKSLWRRLAPALDRLGVLSQIDVTAFEAFCAAYDRWRTAEAAVKKNGLVYEKDGLVRPRPEVRMAEAARKELRQLAAEFGMTPAARSRVEASLTDPKQPALPSAEAWPAQEDPSKPKLPEGEWDDAQFFGPRPGPATQH